MSIARINEICDIFRTNCDEMYNESLQAYKAAGGKIIGTLYNQVPEEVILAAGMLPVRLRAQKSTGTERAAARFTGVNCSLVKHFYDEAAKGGFDFIDGLVSTNACDHARKLEENWASELKPPFAYLICFPKRKGDDLQVAHLAQEIRYFKAAFEAHFGIEISDDALKGAIEKMNEIRALQMKIADIRAARKNPPITGTQALAVNMAGTCMPKDEYLELLRELVELCEQLPEDQGVADYKARVVIYGGEVDTFPMLEAIESQGALIVADSLGGFGRRSADMQVATEGDLIENLAFAYLQGRPTEPRLHGTRAERWAYLEKVAADAGAQGYIHIHIPICDLWSYERLMWDVEVANKDLTNLDLDTEYIFATPGQTRTRVQAFVEQINEGGN